MSALELKQRYTLTKRSNNTWICLCGWLVIGTAERLTGQVDVSLTLAEQQVVGCYDILLGEWDRAVPIDSAHHTPPVHTRLDTARLPYHSSRTFAVHPNIPVLEGRSRSRDPGWTIPAPDSLIVYWSSGSYGVRLLLALNRDGWRGVAEAFTDAIGVIRLADGTEVPAPWPQAEVVLTRVTCTGALQPNKSMQTVGRDRFKGSD